jgi:hypothetical protein
MLSEVQAVGATGAAVFTVKLFIDLEDGPGMAPSSLCWHIMP